MQRSEERIEIEQRVDEAYKLIGAIVMRKYRSCALNTSEYDDLVQDCMMTLLEKADKYDSQRGAFSTFVALVVRDTVVKRAVGGSRQKRSAVVVSLDTPIQGEDSGEITLLDLLPGKSNVEDSAFMDMMCAIICETVEGFDDKRMRQIVKSRCGYWGQQPMKLQEIGKQLGITRERVRQLEKEAYRRIRKALTAVGTADQGRETL